MTIFLELQEAVLRRPRKDRTFIVLGKHLFEHIASELRKTRDIEQDATELNLWGARMVLDSFDGSTWRATFSSKKGDFVDFF